MIKIDTKEEFKRVLLGVMETIKEVKEIPSGHLYAQLMRFVDIDLQTYQGMIEIMVDIGFIEVENHLIIYKGK